MSEIKRVISENEKQSSDVTVISWTELTYLAYFAVMLTAKAIGLYEGQLAYNICLVIGAFFFACKMVITKHSLIELIIDAALLGLGLIVYMQSGEKSLLIFITMMVGIKGVSKKRVFKLGAIIWVTAFVGMYILSVIGVIPEIAYTIDRHGWPPILRHSLGYPHPNTLHVTYLILAIFVLYSCKDLSKKYITAIAIILMLGDCYVFMYSLSRNGFLTATAYIVIVLYFTLRDNRSNVENWLIRLIFPICSTVMIIFPVVLKGEVFERLNTITAGRFMMTRYFLTYGPLKLFGIESIPNEENFPIDSSYVYLIFRLGIIAFIIYFIAMIFLINAQIKRDERADLSVTLALTGGGVIETYLFNQSYKNLIFIFLGCYMYEALATLAESGKMPQILTKDCIGLSFGNKNCLWLNKVLKSGSENGSHKNGRRIPVNIFAFSAVLFILAGLITSCTYLIAVPAPGDIYLPASEAKVGETDEVYLDKNEVKELKKAGNIVRGYVNENTPLYRMHRKGAAKVEYIRYIFSYGLWGGSIVCVCFLTYWTAKSKVRYLLKNKSIGSEYKENVLIVHNYYRVPGGEDVVVANEKALLEAHGHKVVTYTRNNDEIKNKGIWNKIGLLFISLFNARTYRDICKIIDKEKIDVIQVHNTIALISPAVYLAGINRGVPVLQTVHNFRLVCPNGVCYVDGHVCENCLVHGLKASLVHNCYRDSRLQTFVCALSIRLQRFLLTYKELNYICLTEFNKSKIMSVKQIRPENIYIKPNFTTIDIENVPYEQRKRQVVYAGRLEKIKGVDILLQAWMKLGENAPKLVICGSGELEDWCKNYIENNELNNVEMLGQLSNSETKKLIGESLAMVHPTQWYEGFPMTIAEAYTLGTPIIASDIGNVGDLVIEGVTGVKYKSSSVVALAKAVEKFMDLPIQLPEEYVTKYTADNNYKMLKEIFEDVRMKHM